MSCVNGATYPARYNVLDTNRHIQLFFRMTGTRNSCARYRVRYRGKNAFVCTSNAYAHSTLASLVEVCDGGESKARFANAQRRVARTRPTRRKSRKIMRKMTSSVAARVRRHAIDQAIAAAGDE